MNASTTTAIAPKPVALRIPEGAFVNIDGEVFYRIENYDAMPPFFMSIVSSSDHYLFISSNGGLTAGRKDPDHALFPYYTDDRIHDSCEHTGSKTICRVDGEDGAVILWEPFSERGERAELRKRTTRNLYKSVYGTKVVFEEVNHELDLAFSYEWAISDRFGLVRTSRLENRGSHAQPVDVLDGLQNLLPAGLTRRFQLEYSTLVDGYKRTELEPETGLALVQLTSVPVDRPEPSESLSSNIVWSVGLERPIHLLCSVQLDQFRKRRDLVEETNVHGRRGAYFLSTSLVLSPNTKREWKIIADVNKDTAGVRSLLHVLKHSKQLSQEIDSDVALTTENLMRIVCAADGLQQTGDQGNTWHHFASTLFNVMRGGIPDNDYRIDRDDFAAFLRDINRQVAKKHKAFIASLPVELLHDELLKLVREKNDLDLERIAQEYLPLTFSRRHGDPSRPWNVFDICLKDAQGRKLLNYQGNWRDIFQNWEALSYSYPGFAVSMIYKFLNASTADGYNPYKVSRNGYEWEILDPHDPWSCIGYWGDHQVIYLLRLLEQAQSYDPASLSRLLTREVFTFANVPYRIRAYADLLRDSQNTIVFDFLAHKKALRNAAKLGADGKALAGADGQLIHANLTEKILVLLLAKLSNFVPEAGIWLNTQRPEWNDANNALVGAGISMVTLYHLRRFLVFAKRLLPGIGVPYVSLHEDVAVLFDSIQGVLEWYSPKSGASISDRERKTILDALGEAGSQFRESLYARGISAARRVLPVTALEAFFECALLHVDHSIRANRREDGLYHAYNVMELYGDEIRIGSLPLMLEGQVAVLSSGALSPKEAVSLLDALRNSALYRHDQNSYILYPQKMLPSFFAKNNISAEAVSKSELLKAMIARDDRRIVVRDADGGVHFNAALRNGSLLRQELAGIKDRAFAQFASVEADQISGIYEEVFQHRYFTGRSGTLYKYEGIGCIYWHMVSKLLLAVREVLTDAVEHGAEETVLGSLRAHYNSVRDGLGIHKTPAVYGAVPTDPYSHTPSFAGAQQPGMTGQVKEDFIARIGEMGVTVSSGQIQFKSELITCDEFLKRPETFSFWDLNGSIQTRELEPGTLAFTFCQVPIIAHREGQKQIRVTYADDSKRMFDGSVLSAEISNEIFKRTGIVREVEVFFGFTPLQSVKNRAELNAEVSSPPQ